MNGFLNALSLIAKAQSKCLLGDQAYAPDAIREDRNARDAVAVISPMANRSVPAAFDTELDKARSAVECTFNLREQARRFTARYEKALRNHATVVSIGRALLWLRVWPRRSVVGPSPLKALTCGYTACTLALPHGAGPGPA
jgi:transposase